MAQAYPVLIDGSQADAFGRVRVSSPYQLIEEKAVSASPAVGNFASGGGSYSKPANRSSFYLTTGGIGSLARRQTRQRAVYQPGKSQHIEVTFTLGALTPGITQRVGYFDDSNGLFFEADGTDFYFVIRSKITGSVVDTRIPRSLWSDKLDGYGESGILFDPTKSQILNIDFQWLGVGRTRFGFVIDGQAITCASNMHANNRVGVYMTTPNQPVRWEVLGASSAAAVTLEAICASVSSEGGFEFRGITIAHDTDGTAKAITAAAYAEVMAVRLTAAGALSGTSLPVRLSIITPTDGDFLWELWLNATGPTGGTWSTPTASLTEQNTTRTGAYTGGVKLDSGFVSAALSSENLPVSLSSGLGYDINAAVADILSVRVYNLAGNNNYHCSLTMRQEA
jgi:hypothetical protein